MEEIIKEEVEVSEVATETVETAETEIAEIETTSETKPQPQKMNLPNKLTLLRICLVPIMVAMYFIGSTASYLTALVVFVIASITDYLDGHIARKNNLVTDFGKFLDPIADKLLVVTALVLIMHSGIVVVPYVAEISLIIVIAREFAISGLRLIASNNGTVIAADKLGKLKTVTQIVAIILFFVTISYNSFVADFYYAGGQVTNAMVQILAVGVWATIGVYVLSTLICIISGISYLVKNKNAYMLSK